jgi:NAD/NADP transhydrogenase beta subunit
LLERAAKHLKHPAIIVRANGRDIRLNIAGAAARVPGSINVCSAERG